MKAIIEIAGKGSICLSGLAGQVIAARKGLTPDQPLGNRFRLLRLSGIDRIAAPVPARGGDILGLPTPSDITMASGKVSVASGLQESRDSLWKVR